MANTTFTVALNQTTPETQAAWASAISAALDRIGFPKTADTGQVDWSNPPALINGVAGYEIRTFTDSQQALRPLVFKVEYGSFGNANWPQVWISVGKGSDGAGNLTDILIPRATSTFTSPGNATLRTGYASSADGSICAVALIAPNGPSITFSIERSSSTDAATGSGVAVVGYEPTGGATRTRVYAASYAIGALTYTGYYVNIPRYYGGADMSATANLATEGVVPLFSPPVFALGAPAWDVAAFKVTPTGSAPVDTASVLVGKSLRVYKKLPRPALPFGTYGAESTSLGQDANVITPMMWWE